MKIAIIENQYDQFSQISGLLKGHTLFPKDDQYKTFLDKIRVQLNPRYSAAYRATALEGILQAIADFEPDLLIIDHILVGNHSAENGIQLAKKLRKRFAQPILFLSRTAQNHVDVCKYLPGVKGAVRWASKGYAGEEILAPEFFKKNVLPLIRELVAKSNIETKSHYLDAVIIKFKEVYNAQGILSRQRSNAHLIDPVKELGTLLGILDNAVKEQRLVNEELMALCERCIAHGGRGKFGSPEWKVDTEQLFQILNE